MNKLLSKREVAEILSISVRSVERLVARGIIRKIKIGGSIRFRQCEIEKLMEKGEKV